MILIQCIEKIDNLHILKTHSHCSLIFKYYNLFIKYCYMNSLNQLKLLALGSYYFLLLESQYVDPERRPIFRSHLSLC